MGKSTRTPSSDAMRTAADWLEVNEGADGEADDCAAVCKWLRKQADEKDLRAIARSAGVPVKAARAAVAAAHTAPLEKEARRG